jgi:hypothetical protein
MKRKGGQKVRNPPAAALEPPADCGDTHSIDERHLLLSRLSRTSL